MKTDKNALMKEVGKRIRKIRMDKELQQNQLSKEFECVPSKIANIEKGTRDPGVDFYFWFAERTGCSLDYIICGKVDQRSQRGESEPQGKELKKAIMALLDSFMDGDEGRKYMVQRHLVPVEFDPKTGKLTQLETELINSLRGMHPDDAIEVMDHAKKLKRS